jgi:hypothetical protein
MCLPIYNELCQQNTSVHNRFAHKSATHGEEIKIKEEKYSVCQVLDGSTIVQVSSCMFLTTNGRIYSRHHPRGICGRVSSIRAGVSPSTLVFPCQL